MAVTTTIAPRSRFDGTAKRSARVSSAMATTSSQNNLRHTELSRFGGETAAPSAARGTRNGDCSAEPFAAVRTLPAGSAALTSSAVHGSARYGKLPRNGLSLVVALGNSRDSAYDSSRSSVSPASASVLDTSSSSHRPFGKRAGLRRS